MELHNLIILVNGNYLASWTKGWPGFLHFHWGTSRRILHICNIVIKKGHKGNKYMYIDSSIFHIFLRKSLFIFVRFCRNIMDRDSEREYTISESLFVERYIYQSSSGSEVANKLLLNFKENE